MPSLSRLLRIVRSSGRLFPAIRRDGCDSATACLSLLSYRTSRGNGFFAPIREDQLRSFSELIDVLRTSGIHSECVVVPLPVVGLQLVSIKLYLDWMRFVVQQCGTIWDFSFPGRITSDNYNYWDVDHFLPHVAKMMLTRVLDVQNSDFGAHISVADFEAYRRRWEGLEWDKTNAKNRLPVSRQ